jgi:hypothetical protein
MNQPLRLFRFRWLAIAVAAIILWLLLLAGPIVTVHSAPLP